jgi:energy-coupling factor transport system permease protein
MFLLVVLPLAALGRVLPNLLSTAIKIAIPFAISVFLIQGLFWQGGTPVVYLGPLSFKAEGLLFALQSTGRILVVVGSVLLLSLTTRPDALMIALDQRGAPKALTYIVLATMQIAPRFQAKANTILTRAHAGWTQGGIGRRVRAIVRWSSHSCWGASSTSKSAMALDARAFSRKGQKTSLLVLRDSGAQRVARVLLLLGALASIAAGVWLRRVL